LSSLNNNRSIPKYIKKIIVEINLAKAILRWAGVKDGLKKKSKSWVEINYEKTTMSLLWVES
jgi:hypothetical protein